MTECEAPAQALVIPSDIRSQFRTLLRIKTLVVLIGIQVFANFVLLGVVSTFMPTYLQQKDVFGLSSGAVGLSFGALTVGAGVIGTLLGGSLAEALNRRHSGARVLVCGIGFLLSAPTFAVAVLTHNLIVCISFFFLTVLLWMFYQGPSTAATQDVVPAVLRATAVALSVLIAHLLGDAFAPSLVGTLAMAFDPTHGLHFQQGLAGQELRLAMLITCTPALLIAGLLGIVGARWMKSDVAAAEAADRLAEETG